VRPFGSLSVSSCGGAEWALSGPVVLAHVQLAGGSERAVRRAADRALQLLRDAKPGSDAAVVAVHGESVLALPPTGAPAPDSFELLCAAKSEKQARALAREWRNRLADIPGAAVTLFAPGEPRIVVELAHADPEVLSAAARELAQRLREWKPVVAVTSSARAGEPQFDFRLTDRARKLGLTAHAVARQVRDNLWPQTVARFQRGRDEVPVLLSVLPEVEPEAIGLIFVTAPDGTRIPLREIADIERRAEPAEIYRRDRQRTVVLTAVLASEGDRSSVSKGIRDKDLPALRKTHPEVSARVR
jgi:multidrug efflux pump subunit AcrB